MREFDLDQCLKVIEPILGFVAHKLNNSLAVINGYTEILKAKHTSDNATLKNLNKISIATNNINDFLIQLLLLSDRCELCTENVEFSTFCSNLIVQLDEILNGRLETKVEKLDGQVCIDCEKINLAVLSLVKVVDQASMNRCKISFVAEELKTNVSLKFKLCNLFLTLVDQKDFLNPFVRESVTLRDDALVTVLLYSIVKKHNGTFKVCIEDNGVLNIEIGLNKN